MAYDYPNPDEVAIRVERSWLIATCVTALCTVAVGAVLWFVRLNVLEEARGIATQELADHEGRLRNIEANVQRDGVLIVKIEHLETSVKELSTETAKLREQVGDLRRRR